jgi:hypothetical protein
MLITILKSLALLKILVHSQDVLKLSLRLFFVLGNIAAVIHCCVGRWYILIATGHGAKMFTKKIRC